mgnify:CR=1 FL=1
MLRVASVEGTGADSALVCYARSPSRRPCHQSPYVTSSGWSFGPSATSMASRSCPTARPAREAHPRLRPGPALPCPCTSPWARAKSQSASTLVASASSARLSNAASAAPPELPVVAHQREDGLGRQRLEPRGMGQVDVQVQHRPRHRGGDRRDRGDGEGRSCELGRHVDRALVDHKPAKWLRRRPWWG